MVILETQLTERDRSGVRPERSHSPIPIEHMNYSVAIANDDLVIAVGARTNR